MSNQYEYEIFDVAVRSESELKEKMNEYGQQGWHIEQTELEGQVCGVLEYKLYAARKLTGY